MPTISNSISNFVNYRMNILHAHYRFNIPLINLNLGDVPLNLNLVYKENYSYYPTGLRKGKEITYQDGPTHKHEYIYKLEILIL